MSVYDVESLTSLANQIAPYVSQVLASKHKKEVSSIDLVTDFTNLYSLPCYYWNRQTGVKRPVNVAVSDLISTVETAANEELIKIKEMAKDSAESADRADQAAQQSAQSAAESAATALDQKNQTIDYLNTVKDDEATRITNENTRLANEQERKTNESGRIDKENIRRSNEDIRIQNENERIKNENERKSQEITRQSNEALRLEQEQNRQDTETIRNSNENTRISNENTRKTQETNRQNKEAERQQSETDRINSENERNTNEDERKANELTRIENENTRLSQEQERVNAENTRKEQETDRESAENTREQNEATRQNQESTRQSQEATRVNQESSRVTAESSRVNTENTRVSNENTRKSNETTRTNNENSRKSAEQSRVTAEANRVKAEQDRVTAENNREEQFNISKEAADQAADRANDVASHQPYIGEDLYWYLYDESTKSYNKTTKYSKGDNFSVKATFSSIAEMEAYVNPSVETASNPILKIGDFIVIATDVEQVDNAKLYVVSNVTSTKITFDYIADFSGARGFTGHTPQLSIGTITTGSAGTAVSVSLTEDGIDTNGNPKYKINFTIPRGDKGEPFTYNDFTEEQITNLQKPAIDAAAIANEAADKANIAATNADDKASLANTAAQTANTAASNADQATADAINATADAEAATNSANQAATNANNAASSANSAADNANNAVANLNWDNLSGKPSTFPPSEHTHSYAGSSSVGGAANEAKELMYTGTSYSKLTAYQTNESYMNSDANYASYIICNHGDGATYFNQTIRMPFEGIPQYQRLINGKYSGWKDFITSENISSQAVNSSDKAIAIKSRYSDTLFYVNIDQKNVSDADYITVFLSNELRPMTFDDLMVRLNAFSNNGGTLNGTIKSSVFYTDGTGNQGIWTGRYMTGTLTYNDILVLCDTLHLEVTHANIATYDLTYTLSVGGSIGCTSLTQTSDVRKKNIINDTELLIDDIANAPLFTYTFKDSPDKAIHVGTSAQYWEGVNSGLFTSIDSEGIYGLEVPNLALCSVISIAKQFKEYKEQTDKKIEDLQNQINELKELINTLK